MGANHLGLNVVFSRFYFILFDINSIFSISNRNELSDTPHPNYRCPIQNCQFVCYGKMIIRNHLKSHKLFDLEEDMMEEKLGKF